MGGGSVVSPSWTSPPARDGQRTGLWLGVGAHVLWGLLPLLLRLLRRVDAMQVLAHRALWSLAILVALVVASRSGPAIRAALRLKTVRLLMLSAVLIAVNWGVYIWSVQHAHVVEASLGYFISPLVNVAIAVAVLGERISRVQRVAIAITSAGVIAMILTGGGASWISIALAASFGLYGFVRKIAATDALAGTTIETALLAPAAAGLLLWASARGESAWAQSGSIDLLLVLSGAGTAAPLLLFAAAVRRVDYSTLGLLQYIAPTLQFLEAVLLFHEPLRAAQAASFALIWVGCAAYAYTKITERQIIIG